MNHTMPVRIEDLGKADARFPGLAASKFLVYCPDVVCAS